MDEPYLGLAGSVEGQTPLMAAAAYGDPKMVEVLLRAGADASLMDVEGHTGNGKFSITFAS